MKLEDIGPVKDFNGSPFLLCFFFYSPPCEWFKSQATMERAVSLQYIHTNVHTKLQVFFFRKDQNSQDPHERFHRRKIDAVHEKKKNQLRHQEKNRLLKTEILLKIFN